MGMQYTRIDQELIPGFSMSLPEDGLVEFQFPPKITNDSMSGEFRNVTTPIPGHYPMFVYAGPNERYFTIETCYIVDGATWSTSKIKEILKKLRGYYFKLRLTLGANKGAIKCKFWDMSGDSETTFFMRNLNIKHSQTMISGKNATGVFPLRTDVTFDLVLWWNFMPIKNALAPKNGVDPVGGGGGGGGPVGRSQVPGGLGGPVIPIGDKDKGVYGNGGGGYNADATASSSSQLRQSGSGDGSWY
jgi:hypothetical protein